ncbi:hypothetical protein HZB78_00385 [Candidatus Collierbacteria bacterium]|nr:hypothetical protein [Candidatus Collierbacteria bacterium]
MFLNNLDIFWAAVSILGDFTGAVVSVGDRKEGGVVTFPKPLMTIDLGSHRVSSVSLSIRGFMLLAIIPNHGYNR